MIAIIRKENKKKTKGKTARKKERKIMKGMDSERRQ